MADFCFFCQPSGASSSCHSPPMSVRLPFSFSLPACRSAHWCCPRADRAELWRVVATVHPHTTNLPRRSQPGGGWGVVIVCCVWVVALTLSDNGDTRAPSLSYCKCDHFIEDGLETRDWFPRELCMCGLPSSYSLVFCRSVTSSFSFSLVRPFNDSFALLVLHRLLSVAWPARINNQQVVDLTQGGGFPQSREGSESLRLVDVGMVASARDANTHVSSPLSRGGSWDARG